MQESSFLENESSLQESRARPPEASGSELSHVTHVLLDCVVTQGNDIISSAARNSSLPFCSLSQDLVPGAISKT